MRNTYKNFGSEISRENTIFAGNTEMEKKYGMQETG
jgi:hypothetical protein